MTETRNILTIIMLVLLCGTLSLQAQQTITTTGGEANGSGGSASYNVGQTFYTNSIGTNGNSIAQGVQQPYEISTTIGINETSISLEMIAYPNPTSNFLILKVDTSTLRQSSVQAKLSNQQLSYQLYDMQGKLLKSMQICSKSTTIEMEGLSIAIYFLTITKSNKLVKTFKIIKNN